MIPVQECSDDSDTPVALYPVPSMLVRRAVTVLDGA